MLDEQPDHAELASQLKQMKQLTMSSVLEQVEHRLYLRQRVLVLHLAELNLVVPPMHVELSAQ